MNLNYIKMSPLTGMVGYGGGGTGLTLTNSAIPKWYGERGIPKGYIRHNKTHYEIEYITIQTPGNGTDFGDLYADITNQTGFGGQGMGIFACGQLRNGSYVVTNSTQYITIATLGSGADFCDMIATGTGRMSCSDGNRGIVTGGSSDPDSIEYTEIATKSNGANFGNLLHDRVNCAATNDDTYAAVWGGTAESALSNIDRMTIQTPSNATDFGDMTHWTNNSGENNPTYRNNQGGVCSDQGRGLAGGGYRGTGGNDYNSDFIDYIVHATPANATSFGNLTVGRTLLARGNCSSSTRGVFSAGDDGSGGLKTLDYITFASASNATSFGSLSSQDNCEGIAACSGD